MTANSEKILAMTNNFTAENYKGLTGELTPDIVYEYLYQKSVVTWESITENNKLLNEWLYPLLKNVKNLTADQADDLFALSQALFQPTQNLDIGLASTIYAALIDYARAAEDEDFLIKCLYWSALSLFYMDKYLFSDEILHKFTEASDFRRHYKEIKSFETRKYINRSLGNIYVILASRTEASGPNSVLKAMDEARIFWEDPDIRAFDPDMPWDSFIYSIHQNTCSTLTPYLREHSEAEGIAALAERLYESAVFYVENAPKYYGGTQAASITSRLAYSLICAKYHSGRITAQEAGERLLEMTQSVEEGDYSLDAVQKMTHTGLTAMFYLGRASNIPKDELNRLTDEYYMKVVAYCSKIPGGATQFTADSMIGDFVRNISDYYVNKDLFIDIILKFTSYRHLSSYVHALSVSWLGELICTYLSGTNPEYLVGIAGTGTVQEVTEKQEEIIDYARVGGLCHDVGKILYINIIANHGRKLSNREFAIVQRHPDKGYELLKNSGYEGIAEIARGHHKWYDGSRGFPKDYDHRESVYRPIIEIITVCNFIDKSTDILGGANAVGLTLQETVKQIKTMSGTKYAPQIADALGDAHLLDSIDHLLTVRRREAYCTAYCHLYSDSPDQNI